ncbi:MAG: ArsR family transcriptional regulator [Phycisphaeraceae bacterium]|nr:ArsR family transcriptional regulator [Phycisphaeraceae bacterium]
MKRSTNNSLLTDRLVALGEMVRLRILRMLEREELSVGEVARIVQLPQSTVSRHLKVLGDGGWLLKRTEGTATFYRLVLDDLPLPCRELWLVVREQLGGPTGTGTTPELAEDVRRLAAVLAERRSDSQAFFGRVAGQWDDVRGELFGSRFTAESLLALLPREWTVVDIGCGTGNVSELLSPLVKRVIAVDASSAMLKAAQKRLDGRENIEFVRGEIQSLPLKDASADAAVAFLVLHHVPEISAALAEMRRVLRPGGVALIVDMVEHDRQTYRHTMGHHWLGFSEQRLGDELRRAGFGDARFVPLAPEPEAKGPGLFVCTAFAEER